jgi:plasmid stability protein
MARRSLFGISTSEIRLVGCVGQLTVRGLDDHLVQSLKQRAARHGRSAESEHRAILEQALRAETETFAEAAAHLRARMPAQTTDSTVLIREARDKDSPATLPTTRPWHEGRSGSQS